MRFALGTFFLCVALACFAMAGKLVADHLSLQVTPPAYAGDLQQAPPPPAPKGDYWIGGLQGGILKDAASTHLLLSPTPLAEVPIDLKGGVLVDGTSTRIIIFRVAPPRHDRD